MTTSPPPTPAGSDLNGAGDRALVEEVVAALAAHPRPSASQAEWDAARRIAGWLREHGADARVEFAPANGTYWWPLGVPVAAGWIAAVAGLARRRSLGAAAVGALATHSVVDDIRGGRRFLRRRVLRRRWTANVVARAGDVSARQTLVLVSHTDTAHSGAIFSPVSRTFEQRFPNLVRAAETSLPVMYPVVAGPALAALGALLGRRRLSAAALVLCGGTLTVLADVARRPAVPGANDNASGVATLVAVARRLRERPVQGLRVLLLSTGSEESFTEGMSAFLHRHRDDLDPETTRFLVVDCTGGPTLVQLEGEGMLYITPYDQELKTLVSRAGREEGIGCLRGLTTRSITDALPAARQGYRAAMLTSVDPVDSIPNYHWPTDLPENVDYDTVMAGVRICDRVIRQLAERVA